MPWSFMQERGVGCGPGVHCEGAEQPEVLKPHFTIVCNREAERATWQESKHITWGGGKNYSIILLLKFKTYAQNIRYWYI